MELTQLWNDIETLTESLKAPLSNAVTSPSPQQVEASINKTRQLLVTLMGKCQDAVKVSEQQQAVAAQQTTQGKQQGQPQGQQQQQQAQQQRGLQEEEERKLQYFRQQHAYTAQSAHQHFQYSGVSQHASHPHTSYGLPPGAYVPPAAGAASNPYMQHPGYTGHYGPGSARVQAPPHAVYSTTMPGSTMPGYGNTQTHGSSSVQQR